jgi:hypothetical protein
MTELELLNEINSNLRNLLFIMASEALPEERKYVFLKNMKFTSAEISRITGIPERTVRDKWSAKSSEDKNVKKK